MINGNVINQFPYEGVYEPGKNLSITNKGTEPIYFTAYQQTWNPSPAQVDGDFTLTTDWKEDAKKLIAGKPVTMEVNLHVKRATEFVMVTIPIPAGCSFQNKIQQRTNGEVHREYDLDEVRIYCESLRPGNYRSRLNSCHAIREPIR